MGSPDNIVEKTLQEMADKKKKSLDETKKEIFQLLAGRLNHEALDPDVEAMFTKAATAWGQSVDEAKKNTFELLKMQIKA